MAVDMFLKITGIEGESTDAKHKGSIDIESFSWGATQQGAMAGGGGGGAGKVSMQDFHFVMRASKASPKLFEAAATGKHLEEAILTARKSGGGVDFYKIKLTDILVSSYQQAGSADAPEGPNDAFSFNFSKIEIDFASQDHKGAVRESTRAEWSELKR